MREAGLFLRVVFLRVVVLGLDLLLLLNDRLDLPTAGWWRGTFSETGVSLLLIRQALPDLRHLQRADACFRVREGTRHCKALLCEASIFLRLPVCHAVTRWSYVLPIQ